ncbi:MAG: hypothetical protein FJ026_17315 [Chloroflexi bacterium]|nr:hypothetical protein [Chloroflexota bacterium]
MHQLEHCPDCGCKLYQHKVARRRQVIDPPPPAVVEVTEHRVVKRYCPRCERWRSAFGFAGRSVGAGAPWGAPDQPDCLTWRARALNPFTQCFTLLAQGP